MATPTQPARRRRLGLLACIAALCGCGSAVSQTKTVLTPSDPVLVADTPRYGLNLGGSGTWGAEQLRANVLANPGFEAVLDRAILIVKEVSDNRVVDDTSWVARSDAFWNGGRYEIRSGAAAGRGGQITRSRRRADGLAEISLDGPVAGIKAGNVIVLTRDADLKPAPRWWIGKGKVVNAPGQPRPGSPGRQSIRLLATATQPAEVLHYLDNIGSRAGKLLPVRGKWRLEFWARALSPSARLHVRFDRGGRAVFLDTDVALGENWQHHVLEFSAQDDGPYGVLTFGLQARSGEVQIDDVWLGEAAAGSAGFRREVVQTLKALRPGFLRDWQGQLGDTLTNRLAVEHGHQPARYRAGDAEAQFHYPLPDFLALCAEVGAEPWVVAPTTLNDREWRAFGVYLRQAADRHGFRRVLLEFGNENWNAIFRPGAIPDSAAHAAVADRAFRLLREGSRNDPRIVTVANAQFVNPESARKLGEKSHEADRIAVAPYFLYRLDAGTSLNDARHAAFSESGDLLRQQAETARRHGKRIAVYEESLHTTLGNADPVTRNAVVTGAASGPALARRLLQGTLAGVAEQAVYSFAGFDSYVQDGKSLVRLWGITRDLAAAHRLRPTGLALELLNRVAGGPAQFLRCAGPGCAALTAVAFGGGRRLAIVSASAEPLPLELRLSCPTDTLQAAVLDGSDASLNNENDTQVAVRAVDVGCVNGRVDMTLPPYSLAVVGH